MGTFKSKARCTVLAGDINAQNRFGHDPAILPETKEINVSETFEYEVPSNSITILRIPGKK
jgi:alpha-L-arabinofuranosidase